MELHSAVKKKEVRKYMELEKNYTKWHYLDLDRQMFIFSFSF